MSKRFLKLNNAYTNSPELVDVDEIKVVGVARDPDETIIRFKRGGYAIFRNHSNNVQSALSEMANVEIVEVI